MNKQTQEALKMVIDYEIELPERVINACKEALEQPVKSITEGATMFKQIGNSPKPPPPPPPMHTCIYSRTMNQEYPRKCIQCGKVEAIGPAQEPVSWLDEMQSITEQEYHQEPVAWQWLKSGHMRKKIPKTATPEHWRPLFTHPHQWQGLTDDEIEEIDDVTLGDYYVEKQAIDFARAIEAKLKEKNT